MIATLPLRAADISWDGEAGTESWHDAANWTGNRVPASGDHVIIGTGARVRFAEGAVALARLTSSGALTIAGGSMEVTGAGAVGSLALEGGSLRGGSLRLTGGEFRSEAAYAAATSLSLQDGATVRLLRNLGTNVTLVVWAVDAGTTSLEVPAGSVATNRGTLMLGAGGRGWHSQVVGGTSSDAASSLLVNEGEVTGVAPNLNTRLKLPTVNQGVITAPHGGNLVIDAVVTNQGGAFRTIGSGTVVFIGGGLRWRSGPGITGSVITRAGLLDIGEAMDNPSQISVYPGTVNFHGNLATNLTILISRDADDTGNSYLGIPLGMVATNRGTIAFNAGFRGYWARLGAPAPVGDQASGFVNEGRLVGRSAYDGNQLAVHTLNRGEIFGEDGGKLAIGSLVTNEGGWLRTIGSGMVLFNGAGLRWRSGPGITGKVVTIAGVLDIGESMDNPSQISVYPGTVNFHGNLATNLTILISRDADDTGNSYLGIPLGMVATNRGTIAFNAGFRGYWARLGAPAPVGDQASGFVNEGRLVGRSAYDRNQLAVPTVNRGEIFGEDGGTLAIGSLVTNEGGWLRTIGSGTVLFNGAGLRWRSGPGIVGKVVTIAGVLDIGEAMDNPSQLSVFPGTVNFHGNLATNLTILISRDADDTGNSYLRIPLGMVATNRGTIAFNAGPRGYLARLDAPAPVGDQVSGFVNEGRLVGESAYERNRIAVPTLNRGEILSENEGILLLDGLVVNERGSLVGVGSGQVILSAGGLRWHGGSGIKGAVKLRTGLLDVIGPMDEPSTLWVERPTSIGLPAGYVNFHANLATNLTLLLRSGSDTTSQLLVPMGMTATNRGSIVFAPSGALAAHVETFETVDGAVSVLVNEGRLASAADAGTEKYNCYATLINDGVLEAVTRTRLILAGPVRQRTGLIRSTGTGKITFRHSVSFEGGGAVTEQGGGIEFLGPALTWSGGQIRAGVALRSGSLAVGAGVTAPSELLVQGSHTFLGNESAAARLKLLGSGVSLNVPLGGQAVNRGVLQLDSSAGAVAVNVADSALLTNLGRIESSGGSSSVNGAWENAGVVKVSGGQFALGSAWGRLNNRSLIQMDRGTWVFQGATLRNFPGGWISASGVLDVGSGVFIQEGLLDPQPASGGLTIRGDYRPAESAGLWVDVDVPRRILDARYLPGETYDLLRVTGVAALNGGLMFRFVADAGTGLPLYPLVGDTMEILTAGSVQGTFTRTNALNLDETTSLVLQYAPASVRLTARTNDNRAALAIVQHPLSRTVPEGASLSLSVVASGTPPLSYQWFRNGDRIAGATSDTLAFASLRPGDSGSYSVRVSNRDGQVLSQPALVRTLLRPVYLTDRFRDRLVYSDAVFVGVTNNASATVDNGEPAHAGKAGGRSMWMTWRAPRTGIASFTTHGSGFDTLLAVYRGKQLPFSNDAEVVHNDDADGLLTSSVEFNAVEGEEFEIGVDGFAGGTGDLVLAWWMRTDGASVAQIRQHPAGALVEVGGALDLTVTALGSNLRYQWFRDGVALPQANAPALRLAGLRESDAGTYSVEIRSGNGPAVRSDPAVVQIRVRGQVEVGLRNKWEDFLVEPTGPSGRGQAGLLNVGRGSFASVAMGVGGGLVANNTLASRQTSDPLLCAVEAEDATLWWRLRPTASGALTLDTFGSSVDTVVAVHRGIPGASSPMGCNDDANPVDGTSLLTVQVVSGEDYFVQIDSVNGRGAIRLNWAMAGGGVVEAPFALTVTRLGQSLRLTAEVNPGRCELLRSTDLSSWQPVEEVQVSGREWSFVVPIAPGDEARFFLVRSRP